jgi:hypothetical protein
VPLDAHEEAQFRQITSQLLEDDPRFGAGPRWSRVEPVGAGAAGLALLLALASLPLSVWSGWWVIGLAGYLVATLAAVHLGGALLPALRRRLPVRPPSGPPATTATTGLTPAARAGIAWGAGVAVAAVLAAIVLAPLQGPRAPSPASDPSASSTVAADEAPTGPAFARRPPGRAAAATDTP